MYFFHPSRSLIVYILWPTNTGGFLDPNRRISSLGRLTKTSSASPTPNATTNSAVQKGQLSVTPTASLSLSKPSVRLAYAGTSSSLNYLKQNRLKSNVRLTLGVLHPHEYAIRSVLVGIWGGLCRIGFEIDLICSVCDERKREGRLSTAIFIFQRDIRRYWMCFVDKLMCCKESRYLDIPGSGRLVDVYFGWSKCPGLSSIGIQCARFNTQQLI